MIPPRRSVSLFTSPIAHRCRVPASDRRYRCLAPSIPDADRREPGRDPPTPPCNILNPNGTWSGRPGSSSRPQILLTGSFHPTSDARSCRRCLYEMASGASMSHSRSGGRQSILTHAAVSRVPQKVLKYHGLRAQIPALVTGSGLQHPMSRGVLCIPFTQRIFIIRSSPCKHHLIRGLWNMARWPARNIQVPMSREQHVPTVAKCQDLWCIGQDTTTGRQFISTRSADGTTWHNIMHS